MYVHYIFIFKARLFYDVAKLNTLNAVLDFSVQFLQTFNVLVRSFPVSTSISFQESSDHVTESVRVSIQESLLHFGIINENTVGIFEDEVVDFTSCCRPSHCVAETLLNFTYTFISGRKHTLVELGV